MTSVMDIVNATMAKIETHYNAFASEAASNDPQTIRAAFYTEMLNGMKEKPLEDAAAQRIVLQRVSSLRENALEILADRNEI